METDTALARGTVLRDEPAPVSMASPMTETSLKPLAPAIAVEGEKTGVFTSLVRDDGDIAGLVAYSIYKQNKLDWLQAFEAAKGRTPGEAEVFAYILGESTPRRLATYRHLAEATLEGKGPDVEKASGSRPSHGRNQKTAAPILSSALMVTYAIIAVLAVIAIWLAAHYTLTAR